jgi:hypothetical protein
LIGGVHRRAQRFGRQSSANTTISRRLETDLGLPVMGVQPVLEQRHAPDTPLIRPLRRAERGDDPRATSDVKQLKPPTDGGFGALGSGPIGPNSFCSSSSCHDHEADEAEFAAEHAPEERDEHPRMIAVSSQPRRRAIAASSPTSQQ